MPDPVAGVTDVGVGAWRIAGDWACTNDSAEPVCAGGAGNIPVVTATGVGTVYDTAVLTGENRDACCSGGVGYKHQNMILFSM